MNIWPTPFFIISCHGSVKLKRLGPEALHNTLKLVASVALDVGISWNIIWGYKGNTCWLVAMSWCWSFWNFHKQTVTRKRWRLTTHCISSLMAVHWDMKPEHQKSQQYMASLLLFHLPLGAIDLADANQLHSTISTQSTDVHWAPW